MLFKHELVKGKEYKAVSPNGDDIRGTYDMVPGCALVGSFSLDDSGKVEPEFAGETDMFWDGQWTEKDTDTKEALYLCRNGDTWKESELRFVEVSDGV